MDRTRMPNPPNFFGQKVRTIKLGICLSIMDSIVHVLVNGSPSKKRHVHGKVHVEFSWSNPLFAVV